MNKEAQAEKLLTKDELRHLINRIWAFDKEQLKALLDDPKAPMLEKWIGSIIVKGVSLGDPSRFEALLARTIGPLKQELKIEDEVTVHAPLELIAMAKRMSALARTTIDVERQPAPRLTAGEGTPSQGS